MIDLSQMKFEFDDPDLEAVYYDSTKSLGHGPAVDKGFRKAMGFVANASNELDLRSMKGLHYHKLKGGRKHQHGIDVTDKWRIVVERVEDKESTSLLIVSVEDYH